MLDKHKEKYLDELVQLMLGHVQDSSIRKNPVDSALLDDVTNAPHSAIKHKVDLLNLVEDLGNVSKACKALGISRNTFYRYKTAVTKDGHKALLPKVKYRQNQNNKAKTTLEQSVLTYSLKHPKSGQAIVSQELWIRGVKVSPSGVRNIWVKYGLTTAANRLDAFNAKEGSGNLLTQDTAALDIKRLNNQSKDGILDF
jgi:transposase